MADACMQIGSERTFYMMYRDIAHYGDEPRSVFCDELEGYTFHPYIGTLERVLEYAEEEIIVEEARILIVTYATGKVEKVFCHIEESNKKIYIREDVFNKYWKRISENICKGICIKRNSINISQASVNDLVNLSLVENSSRSATIGHAFTIEYKGRTLESEVQRMLSKKVNAMADNRMRFVYGKNDSYVHDKSCRQVESIAVCDFVATDELPENKVFCPCCKHALLIRNAIEFDTRRFSWYQRFFENGKVSGRVLERFLLDMAVKLHMDTDNELIVKCNEDTWHIKMNSHGVYELYHNNYVMVGEKERYITSGFHPQKLHPPSLSGILNYIKGYDWQRHLKAMESREVGSAG